MIQAAFSNIWQGAHGGYSRCICAPEVLGVVALYLEKLQVGPVCLRPWLCKNVYRRLAMLPTVFIMGVVHGALHLGGVSRQSHDTAREPG